MPASIGSGPCERSEPTAGWWPTRPRQCQSPCTERWLKQEMDFPAPYAVDIALSMHSHDRAGVRRTDQAWLDEVWADDATRVVVLAKGQFPVTDGQIEWRSPGQAPEG